MKLYLTAKNERRGRPAKIGSNEKIEAELSLKGIPEYTLSYTDTGLTVHDRDGNKLVATGKQK